MKLENEEGVQEVSVSMEVNFYCGCSFIARHPGDSDEGDPKPVMLPCIQHVGMQLRNSSFRWYIDGEEVEGASWAEGLPTKAEKFRMWVNAVKFHARNLKNWRPR